MNRRLHRWMILLPVLFVLAGCQSTTRVTHLPQINQPARLGTPPAPTWVTITDERLDRWDSRAMVANMREGLERVYGNAIQVVQDRSRVPTDQTHVDIQVRALGASLRHRLVRIPNLSANANVISHSSGQTGSPEEGGNWWFGQSHLVVKVNQPDGRRIERQFYTEDAALNLLGRSTGSASARRAWQALEPELFSFLDEIIRAGRTRL